jgi:hypothetical protein
MTSTKALDSAREKPARRRIYGALQRRHCRRRAQRDLSYRPSGRPLLDRGPGLRLRRPPRARAPRHRVARALLPRPVLAAHQRISAARLGQGRRTHRQGNQHRARAAPGLGRGRLPTRRCPNNRVRLRVSPLCDAVTPRRERDPDVTPHKRTGSGRETASREHRSGHRRPPPPCPWTQLTRQPGSKPSETVVIVGELNGLIYISNA